MKVRYEIIQLKRLGKPLKQYTIRKTETSKTLEISTKIYGPTSLQNCLNKLKGLKNASNNA